MKFKSGTRRRALEYEKDWAMRWADDKTFEKSVANRPQDNAYVFYDGPPFITGVPHHGTLLSSIVKDAVPRYWTMKGKRVERVWGWDCHGLPAENFVEKQLVITDRRQIITDSSQQAPLDKDGNELPTITLEKYIETARESMVANSETWESVIDRIGRWVDFKGAYRTMDKDFMESVWWAFKNLYDAGKIYEGEKVLMYDTRFATPVSKAEVTMDNDAYQTVTDPSVYVKFKLLNHSDTNSRITIEKIDLNKVDYAQFAEQTRLWPDYTEKIKQKSADNKAILFAAKIGDEYVGRVTLWLDDWKDSDPTAGADKIVTDYFPSLPAIQALEVREEYRRSGVATELLHAAEQEAVACGFSEIGLGVEPDNIAAVKLYEKTGYAKILVDGAERYHCWWQEKNDKGEIQKFDIECYLMKKDLAAEDDLYFLAWTTTPWTLPGNLMLAVNPELTYCEVLVDGEKLIIAEEALERTLKDEKNQPIEYKIVRKYSGKELVGKSYEPLDTGSTWPKNNGVHKIYAADFVSHESGTGIVHCAPAYGEDDFELAKSEGIAPFHVIDDNGYYTDGNYKGLEVWDNNKLIAKDLKEKGIVWKIEYIRHEYPFNPRSQQRIMYRAIPSWFFDIQNSKPLMLGQNENINWFPPHLKHGRFAKNIEQAPDWNLSRDRFWATAMPVWKGDKGTVKVVGSYAELKELSGVELKDYHRPWVDDITFEIDGEHFTRIDKVLDCWFESGSMPFAQLHYPFENQKKFEKNFPGDFIAEYMPQVRAWFYYVHTINTSLAECGAFGEECRERDIKNAFKNVIVTGTLAGNDGRKMSKSLGNFTDPNELMDKFSADSLRFLLLSSPLLSGEDFSLQDKDVGDVARKLSMVWNMYDFFTMYAEVDGWEFDPEKSFSCSPEDVSNPLDKWIISRLHQLNEQVTKHMDEYNIPDAMDPILPFIEDASNWYVRRSRRRFWKSEDDNDKNDAYKTLHYVLLKLSVILAPFTPFLAEELYQKMGGGNESVHLLDWPTNYAVDEEVMNDMDSVKDITNTALALRAKAGKGYGARQPIALMKIVGARYKEGLVDILKEEVNVKRVEFVEAETIATMLDDIIEPTSSEPTKSGFLVTLEKHKTPELKREGLMREVIRYIQNARKNAGLNVDDRIVLHLAGEGELKTAIDEHISTIQAETLTVEVAENDGHEEQVVVEGLPLSIRLKKS